MNSSLVIGLLAVVAAVHGAGQKVMVSVYYEALCPDSIKFVTNQLTPTVAKMMEVIDLTLVPYGKAEHQRLENGSWSFTCHHGPAECYGNKVQACALKHLKKENQLPFVNCVMSMVQPNATSYPGTQCAKTLGLTYDEVERCVDSTEGDDLLAGNGARTKSLQPALTSVPTVVVGPTFDKQTQDDSMTNFMGVVCGKFSADNMPAVCQKSSASSLYAVGLAATLAAALCRALA